VELYLRFPNTPSWRGAQLRKEQGNFTLRFTVHTWRPSVPSRNKEIRRKITVVLSLRAMQLHYEAIIHLSSYFEMTKNFHMKSQV